MWKKISSKLRGTASKYSSSNHSSSSIFSSSSNPNYKSNSDSNSNFNSDSNSKSNPNSNSNHNSNSNSNCDYKSSPNSNPYSNSNLRSKLGNMGEVPLVDIETEFDITNKICNKCRVIKQIKRSQNVKNVIQLKTSVNIVVLLSPLAG